MTAAESMHLSSKQNDTSCIDTDTADALDNKLEMNTQQDQEQTSASRSRSKVCGNLDSVASRLSFPCKLYQMLQDADDMGFRHIVAWNAEGTGFSVHDSEGFLAYIIPKYFSNQSKYKSFQRQLSLYGFTRVTVGPKKGLRYHKHFVRGCIERCRQMKPFPQTTTAKRPKSLLVDNNKHRRELEQLVSERAVSSGARTRTYMVSAMTCKGASDHSAATSASPHNVALPSAYQVHSIELQTEETVYYDVGTLPVETDSTSQQQPSPLRVVTPKVVPQEQSLPNDEGIGFFEGKAFCLMGDNDNNQALLKYGHDALLPPGRPLFQPRLYSPGVSWQERLTNVPRWC